MKLKSIIAILTATFISTSVWGGHHACDYKNKEELKKNANNNRLNIFNIFLKIKKLFM